MNFSPELTGIGKYSGEMARGLVARGHEVRVVCAPPYYPQWRVHAGHNAHRYRCERAEPGLTVYRCPVWLPSRAGGMQRLLHLVSFAVSSLPVLLRLWLWRPDVVFAVAPSLASAPAAWTLARASGASAWLHVQDFEVDAAFELGLLRGTRARRLALGIEGWWLRRFDRVTTVSACMRSLLRQKGVATERAALLPNWVDLDLIHPVDRSPALRERLGIAPDQIVCLFSGTLNRKQGLDVLVEVARRLTDEANVLLVICGEGELRDGLRHSAADLPNVRFIALQPIHELNALLNMADIHLLPQLRGAADLVMPSKLTGMLASGRPVIAAAMPDSEIAAVVVGRGRVVEPESVAGFVAAIRELSADAALRAQLGAAARHHAQAELGADVVLDNLSEQLQNMRPVARPTRNLHPGVTQAENTAGSATTLAQRPLPVANHAPPRRGFTLLELLVVMVIIGLLAAYVGPKYFSQVGKSEVKTAKAQIVGIEKALEQYRLDVGQYPSSEQGLAALLSKPQNSARWEGPYLGKAVPLDPWGHAYRYKAPGERSEVDIFSFGRDNRQGGDGLDADIGNW